MRRSDFQSNAEVTGLGVEFTIHIRPNMPPDVLAATGV
jgi:hypothetical protein